MRTVDMENWERRELYEFFSAMSDPFYSVCFRQDVSRLRRFAAERGCSFYLAMIYLCTSAINLIPAFRYGVKEGKVVLFERREPSFTDMKKGSERFHIVTMPCRGSIEEFCKEAKERSAAQQSFIDQEGETENLIYFSCLPWIDMTAMTNERDLRADDAIPRIAWGRFSEREGRTELNISIELNHAFADGYHIGLFHQKLSELIEALP